MADLYGVAAVIGAVGMAIPSIVAAWISVINLNRSRERDAVLNQVHTLVNGQSAKLEALTFKAGEVSGANQERANPTTLSHPIGNDNGI